MFEFIGVATVAWVLWTLLKAFFAVVAKRRVEMAVIQAMRYGVTPEESEAILEDAAHVKEVRRLMAAIEPEFASKKAWQQLCETIVYIHRNDQVAKNWAGDLDMHVRADIAAGRAR